MDRDVRNAIDEAMIGAAAIGFCLARTLAETDPERRAPARPDLEGHVRVPAQIAGKCAPQISYSCSLLREIPTCSKQGRSARTNPVTVATSSISRPNGKAIHIAGSEASAGSDVRLWPVASFRDD